MKTWTREVEKKEEMAKEEAARICALEGVINQAVNSDL